MDKIQKITDELIVHERYGPVVRLLLEELDRSKEENNRLRLYSKSVNETLEYTKSKKK